jgi:hypothetical protein
LRRQKHSKRHDGNATGTRETEVAEESTQLFLLKIPRIPIPLPLQSLLLAVVVAVFAAPSAAHAQVAPTELPKQLAGCWLTTRALQTSNVQPMSAADAKSFIGRKLTFSPSVARSGDTVLRSPEYYVRQVKDADFADAFRIRLKDIGIHTDRTTEVDIYRPKNQLTEFPGNLLLLKDKHSLLWNWRGTFFEARRCTSK